MTFYAYISKRNDFAGSLELTTIENKSRFNEKGSCQATFAEVRGEEEWRNFIYTYIHIHTRNYLSFWHESRRNQ